MRGSPFTIRGVPGKTAAFVNMDHDLSKWDSFMGCWMICEEADHGANPAKAAIWGAVGSEPAAEELTILADLESAHHTTCIVLKKVPL